MAKSPKRPTSRATTKPKPRPWLGKRGDTQEDAGLRLGFRSGLEKLNAEHLEKLGVPVLFETRKIAYIVPETRHRYTPDFELHPSGILVETKGKFEPRDRAKHLLVQAQHPDLDIRFVFQRAHTPIRKGSPTSYAEWADAHCFKWAARLIPAEWTREPGVRVSHVA